MINRLIVLPLKEVIRRHFESWLQKRIPAKNIQKLNSSNIFVLPTKFGLMVILFIVLLFLMGTNYQNNLVLLLSYLLISLYMTAIFQGFLNLLGLSLKAQQNVKGFVGDDVNLSLLLMSNKPRYGVSAFCPDNKKTTISVIEQGDGECSLNVPFNLTHRGYLIPERVVIESYFAFGLVRCWSKLDFAWQVLAIPKPLNYELQAPVLFKNDNDKESQQQYIDGNDDFHQLKEFILGESMNRVAWKHFARGQGMLTKQYNTEKGNIPWLSIKEIALTNTEQKLQALVYMVIELSKLGSPFGLDLTSTKIKPSSSEQHIEQCLKAIACYEY